MIARFLLQIVDADPPHEIVRLPAGGPLERDLIRDGWEAVKAKGVGFAKTEAQVEQAFVEGMTDMIRGLKWETRQIPRE